MEEVVGEVFLDDVALIATAHDEIVDAVVGVELHDVPQNRPPADLNHGFGPDRGFLTEARAQATGQQYGFHGFNSLSVTTWQILGQGVRAISSHSQSAWCPGEAGGNQ